MLAGVSEACRGYSVGFLNGLKVDTSCGNYSGVTLVPSMLSASVVSVGLRCSNT